MPNSTAPGWLRFLLAAAAVVLLVATPLYLYVRPTFAEIQYARPGFPASTRFGDAERERLSHTLIAYLQHKASYADMADLRTDTGEIALRDSELSHMADVRRVMDGFYWAAPISLALLIGAGLILKRRGRAGVLTRGLREGVIAAVALMGLILVSASVNFDAFFSRFHSLFFRSGTWLFYYEDTLIQLYPEPFWVTAVTAIAITILVEAALVWLVTRLIDRRRDRSI